MKAKSIKPSEGKGWRLPSKHTSFSWQKTNQSITGGSTVVLTICSQTPLWFVSLPVNRLSQNASPEQIRK